MASGDWLLARGEVETIRTPGYPALLALLQMLFGHHALIAVTVCQQLMVFATAMLAAWISARVSGNWLGGLCGLTLGLFCVSQNSVADRLVSDTLFGLLLTLAVAALIAWFRRPTVIAAMFVGLLLGLATLVRPIAQFAWVPILVAMAFRLSNSPRSYSGEGQKVRTNVSPRGEGRRSPHLLPLSRVRARGVGQAKRHGHEIGTQANCGDPRAWPAPQSKPTNIAAISDVGRRNRRGDGERKE